MVLSPGLKRSREEFEAKRVEAFAYMDDTSLSLMGVTANTDITFCFLRRELEDIGLVVKPTKIVALLPKGHAPTTEEGSLLESVGVDIADEVGMAVVGVPIGTYEDALGRLIEVVEDGGANRLARRLANMPNKEAAALIPIEPLGQRASYLERALGIGLSLGVCGRADNGAQWAH